jgi:tRNA dimethylallyltransferase
MERKWLYDRINRRVSRLISDGLVDEVNELIEKGYNKELPSMKAIGYKEVIGFLDGEYDLFDAKELIMKNTRHYAKRQITWLKRYDFVNWIDINKGETVGEIVDRIIGSKESE